MDSFVLQVFEDLLTYMDSLKKLMDFAPKKIFSGHGPVIEVSLILRFLSCSFLIHINLQDPEERLKYYIDHRQERENQILHVLSTVPPGASVTTIGIVKSVYKVRFFLLGKNQMN